MFFILTGEVMANDKASVVIESTDVVYDVRVNGLPLIKSKKLYPRSLSIPAYHLFFEGENTIEVNVSGAYKNAEGKIIEEFGEKSSIFVSVVNDGKKVNVLNLAYDNKENKLTDKGKTYAGHVAVLENEFMEAMEDVTISESEIGLGFFFKNSLLYKRSLKINSYETLPSFWKWKKGEEVSEDDRKALEIAYVEQYEKIRDGKTDEAFENLSSLYKLVALKYEDGDFNNYLKNNMVLETFESVRLSNGNEYRIAEPNFSKRKIEIFGEGRLARIYPEPLRWKWENRKIDSGLIFYKKDGKFIPVFISNDTGF